MRRLNGAPVYQFDPRRQYGDAGDYGRDTGSTRSQYLDANTQEVALRRLAELAERASITPLVRQTAIKIIAECAGRDDDCMLDAVFKAIHTGDANVAPFANGFKYIADPRFADYFTSPTDAIMACLKGACGGDCDDHAALIAALLGSIGWKFGLRAWGPKGQDGYSHVYAVVAYPLRPPFQSIVALDTTVPDSTVGWEPPKGNVMTAWSVDQKPPLDPAELRRSR